MSATRDVDPEPPEYRTPVVPRDDEWMTLSLQVPWQIGDDVLRFLKRCHGFHDVDWLTLGRPDLDCSQVDYDLIPPKISNDYY